MNKMIAVLLVASFCVCSSAVPQNFPYPEHPKYLKLPPGTQCKSLVDLKSMGWARGNKDKFCRKYHFGGSTNPTWLYPNYGYGGLCYNGPQEACRIASGERIPLNPGDTCKALVDMRSLGWNRGNKHAFCVAKHYDGNVNPTRAGYVNYPDGGMCFRGQESACAKDAINWVTYIRSLNPGVKPGW